MAIWLEIHCDTSPDIRDGCASDRNNVSGAMANTPISALRLATTEARLMGWKRVKGVGWACKKCQRSIALARASGAL